MTSALDGQRQNNLSKKIEHDDITLLPQDSCSDLSLPMTLGLRSSKAAICSAQGWYTVDESTTGRFVLEFHCWPRVRSEDEMGISVLRETS